MWNVGSIATLLILTSALAPDLFAAKLTKRAFNRNFETKGVILVDVNWGRYWDCAGFENAQLTELVFENTMPGRESDDKFTRAILKTPSRLFVDPEFLGYGFVVDPGTYAFTGWSIKVARSMTKVGTIQATREQLVNGETYLGGTFSVNQGEAIYIGSFGLDCLEKPIPWRYFEEWGESLDAKLAHYRSEFEFLENVNIVFRLLDTDYFGANPLMWLNNEGNVALFEGDYARAIAAYSGVLEQASASGDDMPRAMAMYNLGRAYGMDCNFAEATKWFKQSIEAKKKLPDQPGFHLSQNLLELGRLYAAQNAWAQAIPNYESGIQLLDDSEMAVDDPLGYANVLDALSQAYEMVGNSERSDQLAPRVEELRAQHPGESAKFAPEPYPRNCD